MREKKILLVEHICIIKLYNLIPKSVKRYPLKNCVCKIRFQQRIVSSTRIIAVVFVNCVKTYYRYLENISK